MRRDEPDVRYAKLFSKDGSRPFLEPDASHMLNDDHATEPSERFDPDYNVDMRDLAKVFIVELRFAARNKHAQLGQLLYARGGDGRTFRRERARAARAIVGGLLSTAGVGDGWAQT